mgnify:CR=1 FL=1
MSLLSKDMLLEDIDLGDIVKGVTQTNSQKYLFTEYNSEQEGLVVFKGTTLYECRIKTTDGDIVPLCYNPGTSGIFYCILIEKKK